MIDKTIRDALAGELAEIKEKGLYKAERVIETPQGVAIITNGKKVLNFCANNYLGLSNHPALIAAAKKGLDEYGYGMSSVRFICGTQTVHKELERTIADFLQKDDAILYSSCFDANAGLFETLLGPDDVIISDKLNHASIIDGIRLCKANRLLAEHDDMADLEAKLKEAQSFKRKLIVTDGVFSMDGDIAHIDQVVALAEKYGALVMVDDSHATGFIGDHGRGSAEYRGVLDKVDIITSTLGKALGGASGGFTAASQEIVDYLRQRSRPYLFSNTLAPAIAATSIAAIQLVQQDSTLRETLRQNTQHFRQGISQLGLDVRPGEHPIVPVMLYDAKVATAMAKDLLEEGIYVIGFSYPVVPEGKARIRVQISAAHTTAQLDQALAAFEKVGKKHGAIK
ncbi:MAG: glycine C-acetyltransferase [Candidatus Kerfeldbacteria bacterium]|nr:glycine C-acetyltransferase [Candidatus Kerfeldbacteria bacterium]